MIKSMVDSAGFIFEGTVDRIPANQLIILQDIVDLLHARRPGAYLLDELVEHLKSHGAEIVPSSLESPLPRRKPSISAYWEALVSIRITVPVEQEFSVIDRYLKEVRDTKIHVIVRRKALLTRLEAQEYPENIKFFYAGSVKPNFFDSHAHYLSRRYTVFVDSFLRIGLELVFAAVVGALLTFITEDFDQFSLWIRSQGPSVSLVALPLIGFAIFFWRERAKFSYGIIEFFVGMWTSWQAVSRNWGHIVGLEFASIFAAATGLYIMVRGLDNIGKALDRTKAGPYWRRVFQGKS